MRRKLPLDSEGLELLLAFEEASTLESLASLMAKDVTVVSRRLKRLSETAPVISKQNGKWYLTPLGSELNRRTEKFINSAEELFSKVEAKNMQRDKPSKLPKDFTLICINTQNGFHHPMFGSRSNPDAESRLSILLSNWRSQNRTIVHVRHNSNSVDSPFYNESQGFDFIAGLEPKTGETVIDKHVL